MTLQRIKDVAEKALIREVVDRLRVGDAEICLQIGIGRGDVAFLIQRDQPVVERNQNRSETFAFSLELHDHAVDVLGHLVIDLGQIADFIVPLILDHDVIIAVVNLF